MKMTCKNCNDYEANIGKVNTGFMMQWVHGFGGYDGKPIEYCPWCGHKLVKDKPDAEK